eukprot:1084066-Pyramimonas_sp.AAC.1
MTDNAQMQVARELLNKKKVKPRASVTEYDAKQRRASGVGSEYSGEFESVAEYGVKPVSYTHLTLPTILLV